MDRIAPNDLRYYRMRSNPTRSSPFTLADGHIVGYERPRATTTTAYSRAIGDPRGSAEGVGGTAAWEGWVQHRLLGRLQRTERRCEGRGDQAHLLRRRFCLETT